MSAERRVSDNSKVIWTFFAAGWGAVGLLFAVFASSLPNGTAPMVCAGAGALAAFVGAAVIFANRSREAMSLFGMSLLLVITAGALILAG